MKYPIPGYQIDESLFHSPRTVIARGWQLATQKRCVIKWLQESQGGMDARAALHREYRLLKRLSGHTEFVPKPVEFIDTREICALIVNDIEAQALLEMLDTPMEMSLFFPLAVRLVTSLRAIHAQGVVHQGLKPEHILVTPDWETTQLIDFGSASAVSSESFGYGNGERDQEVSPYQAPEQVEWARPVDYRADYFALGMVMFHMLTGQPPSSSLMTPLLSGQDGTWSPAAANPLIPRYVSQVCETLCQHCPEDRYQNLQDLEDDLYACWRLWKAAESGLNFFPKHGLGRGWGLPSTHLYERDRERRLLAESWTQVKHGATVAIGLYGASGMGKTRLTKVLRDDLMGDDLQVTAGQFSVTNRYQPLSGIEQILTQLVARLHQLTLEDQAQWLERVESLVPDFGLLTDLVPGLTYFVGHQEKPSVSPFHVRSHRLCRSLAQLLKSFMQPERPLMIILDDLHNADQSSLDFISFCLQKRDLTHCLFVITYDLADQRIRHWHETLQYVREKTHQIKSVGLAPLSSQAVKDYIRDSLKGHVFELDDLATAVLKQTAGNPLRVHVWLRAAIMSGHLEFNEKRSRWFYNGEFSANDQPERNAIVSCQALPADICGLLRHASCIGRRFTFSSLQQLAIMSPMELAQTLLLAIEAGMIRPLSTNYRLLTDQLILGCQAANLRCQFEFCHEQFFEYFSVSKMVIPLQLPKNDSKFVCPANQSERVHHRWVLRRQHAVWLQVRRALDLADYDAAYLHLQELATLPPVSNQNDSDLLAKRYLLARLECLLMRGQMEAARTLLADGRNEIQDSETMARCYLLLLQYFRSCGQWQDAVQAGQQALAILDSPRSQLTRWMEWWEYGGLRWCGRYWSVLGQQSKLENIINQGLKIDLRAGLKAEIFFAMLLPLEELGNHTMLQKITQSLWDMSLRYEPYRFTVHGLIWASGGLSHDKISDLRQLKNMVNLSKVIHERFGELQDECELNLRRILTLSHWFTTWPAMTEDLDKTIDIGIESGDIYNAARAAYHRLSWSLHERIDTLLQRCPEWVDTVEAGNCQGLSLMMRLMIQKYKCLAGCTVRADSLSDKDFDEEEFVELLGSLSNKRLAFVYSLIKAELLYHASQSERALTYINHAWDLRHVVQGQPYIPYLRLYRSLIAADLVYKRRMEKRMAFNIMRQDIRCFRNWSTNNEYYLPLFLLLKAEHAFLRSSSDAEAFYDRAIAAAHDEKMSWLLALIHERAAMMLWDGGKKKLAGIYFNDAISLYEKWGAVGKAQHMIDDLAIQGMSDLAAPHKSEVETGYRSDWWSLQKRGTEGFGNEQLLEALRELASEPQSELLIDKFLRQVLLAANADKVLLIGKQSAKDSFRVFSLTATDHSSEVERGEISEFGQKFPRKVFEYTKNTHRSVVLADARNDRLFASDPYIIESEARSILCWPYIYNGSFQGAVYVENRLTDDIFEPALVDVLTILTTQTFLWLAHLGYWSQLDCEFQEQRRQLQSRSRLLDHMWQYTGCEGFVIDQGGTLSSLTSPAIKSWLTMKKLWRVPFWSVLFEESEANKFDQERVRQVLTECIGADVEHFNRQQHLLPTRMRRFVGRSSYQYHLRWEPLIDHAGEVDKIVVYVSSSDCTAQKGGVADMSEWLTEIDHKVA